MGLAGLAAVDLAAIEIGIVREPHVDVSYHLTVGAAKR